ncbi:D-hexose-6-phosphate mutarotase [Pasteurella canis]|uniref:D-hexose-6-phosphate mutarotase n=1 Tax=Pasteurella canis TaxID=753 RepID=UPI001CBFBBD0|nr:D-hexose-6-phosphate mutarotase [Pasteurella canis]UAX42914.1 D-hexose-6-phosphate mutarotase [Pasteurella canis]
MKNPIQPQFIKHITPELSLYQYHQIPVIVLQHSVGTAQIALQGAHLFSWKPAGIEQDVIWLSEIEPFQQGHAIRGGIPICYPWFGPVKSPSHGTARIRLWQLTDYQIEAQQVQLEFGLFSEDHLIEAKINMIFSQQCELIFTHYGQEIAQVALHSYFNIGDIQQIEVQGLPTTAVSNITKALENVLSPRTISENVDSTYHIDNARTAIVDNALQRIITIEHHNASDVVLWNPWHKATSGMSESGYKTMVCVETGRISRELKQEDQVSAILKVRSVS